MLKRIAAHNDDFSDRLYSSLQTIFQNKDGDFYEGYPIYRDDYVGKEIKVDYLIVSTLGVVIINILNDRVDYYNLLQDEIYNKIDVKLRRYDFLIKKRSLIFFPNIVTYQEHSVKPIPDFPLATSFAELITIITGMLTCEYDYRTYKLITSGFQEAYGINTKKDKRSNVKEGTRSWYIENLKEMVETFDPCQMTAILSDPQGIQRIRGMAGSGKTVVLARKAVELHIAHPEWIIVITYYTRSVKNQLEELIKRFYSIKSDGHLPNFENLRIMQAWGSKNSSGLYYDICLNNEIEPLSLRDARRVYSSYGNIFSKLCDSLLNRDKPLKRLYDCILIDEAQDFDPSFFHLCLATIKQDYRLVYAYDELQNLNETTMASPNELFGINIMQDTPLTVCYRNQKNVIVTAHAIGMGLYRQGDMIQMPGSPDVWKAIGYDCSTTIEEGKEATLYRTPETSPDFLNVDQNDIIDFIPCSDYSDQFNQLYSNLMGNIYNDYITPNNIMIIDLDGIEVNENQTRFSQLVFSLYFNDNPPSDWLKELPFKTHVAGSASPEDFFRDNSIVYSNIYRAKGNEAFFVYILNAQKCINSLTRTKDRNSLFTAITRSKGWVRILGYGEGMDELYKEFFEIKENCYTLHFTKYPTKDEQKRLVINNKDISYDDHESIQKTRRIVKKLLDNEKADKKRILMEILGVSSISELKESLDEVTKDD